jgi:hypothetical protein
MMNIYKTLAAQYNSIRHHAAALHTLPSLLNQHTDTDPTAKMVKLEEVMDEEFVREQDGPHDEDDWDTDSGSYSPSHVPIPSSSQSSY